MISPELFLKLAKIEGILWSVSDVFLIFSVLKTVNLIRKHNNIPAYKKLYYLLLFSFMLTPLLLLTPNLFWYLIIEIIVLEIQYLILIYLLFKNYKLMWKKFRNF